MATSLLVRSTDQTQAQEQPLPPTTHIGLPEPARTRGRKPGKAGSIKKQPQRGMGVAQLERLRLKMTEIGRPESLFLPNQFQYPITHFSPMDHPLGIVPVPYGAGNYGGGGGLCGVDSGLMVQRLANGVCFGGAGQVVMDPARIGNPSARVIHAGSFFETSRELSSMPKTSPCVTDRCDLCFKKKRCNGEHMGLNGGRDKNAPKSPINGRDFLGMNPNFHGDSNGLRSRSATNDIYPTHNPNHEGVEVVAIHRNGSSKGGSVLMEYGFFPGKNGRSNCSKEMELPPEASVAGEASPDIITTAYSANASNSVDLSLKLSL